MSTAKRYQCQYCGSNFDDRSNKYRHEKKYCHRNRSGHLQIHSASGPAKHHQPRKKVVVKLKQNKSQDVPQDVLLEELRQLRNRVEQIEKEPRGPSIQYNNWIIVGQDMYADMVGRYGKEEAVNFLTKSAMSGDSLSVIKKVYLDGVKPDQYPIACRDYRHFRYLNDKYQVVDDNGGSDVQRIFADRAHKAMVVATNTMIQDNLASDSVDSLYKTYDIGGMQDNLTHMIDGSHINETEMIDRLANITNNPNHPFFTTHKETEAL